MRICLAPTSPRRTEISESLKAIDETLALNDVYDGLPAEAQGTHFRLVALTAFYEQHYVCFCRVGTQWILFDDGSRRFVGRHFYDVKEKCVAGRLHPMLLFFEAHAA